jgi:hypothetical protein
VELCGKEMASKFSLKMPDFHVAFRDILHVVNLRHGTRSFTSLPKEGVLKIFSPRKIRRLLPGLNPRTWVLKGQHTTSRPPKPLNKHASLYSSEAYKCMNMLGCKEELKLLIPNRIKVEWIHVACG